MKSVEERIEEILERVTDKFPSRVWIGKDYSIADLRKDLQDTLETVRMP